MMADGDEAVHRANPRCNNELRRIFFSVWVVEKWNSLPDRVREAKTLKSFKNLYDLWYEETGRTQARSKTADIL